MPIFDKDLRNIGLRNSEIEPPRRTSDPHHLVNQQGSNQVKIPENLNLNSFWNEDEEITGTRTYSDYE